MATTLQKKPPGVIAPTAPQLKRLNAESVTTIATAFLKRIGHRGGLKPKKVSFEEGVYTVEVEMKKFTALIYVDAETQDITSYEIQPKGEEQSIVSVSPKTIMVMMVVTAATATILHFAFKFLGL